MFSQRLILLTLELVFVSCTVAAPAITSTVATTTITSKVPNKPSLINHGASCFKVACNDPALITTGPKFAQFSSSSAFHLSITLLHSDTSAALGGKISYLTYDSVTGHLQMLISPPFNVTQIYMVHLINKLTGATSDPVYIMAKLLGCSLSLAGPSSVKICTGPLTKPLVLGQPVAKYTVGNYGASGIVYDSGALNCPIVTASSNGDFTTCYIASDNTGSNTDNYVLGPVAPPLVKFTQTLTITAVPAAIYSGNFFAGAKSIEVTFDPTCNAIVRCPPLVGSTQTSAITAAPAASASGNFFAGTRTITVFFDPACNA